MFPDYPEAINGELPRPPVRTITWFHTGQLDKTSAFGNQYEKEYFQGDEDAPARPQCVLPTGLTTNERHDACRALNGAMLRQEVYTDDATELAAIPYVVTETSYEIKKLQPRKRPANPFEFDVLGFATKEQRDWPMVTMRIPRESRTITYDRVPEDPRISQALTLEVDDYGTVTRSAAIAYPRREVPEDMPEQGVLHCAVAENDVVHVTTDGYRLSVPIESRSFELTGLEFTGPNLLTVEDVNTAYGGADEIAYHVAPTTGLEKRLVQREKARYYDSEDLPEGLLEFGEADARAILYKSYLLDLTDDLIELAFDERVTSPILEEGGYVELAGEDGYWLPSGHAVFNAAQFYLPTSFVDAFDTTTAEVTYDDYNFFAVSVEDAYENTVSAEIDYRILGPKLVTDPNGNRVAAKFDERGMVIAMAVMGKSGDSDGDTLEDPTTRFEYDLFQWDTEEKPAFAHGFARETHQDEETRWIESITYTDGFGRVAMVKAMAEPDEEDNPRWIGSGRTVVDNKGNPIKQYEPYFSDNSDYEDEDAIVATGVTPVLFYDAIGRLTRTDLPNGSYSRVEITPWMTKSFDPNDTVLEEGNLWYLARLEEAEPEPTEEEIRARELAEEHADTPTTTHFDSMGRAFLVIADNADDELFATKTKLDIESQVLAVTDPLERICQTYIYSMAGQQLKETNIDKGARWSLRDVMGAPIRAWDDRDQVFRTAFDDLRRITHLYLTQGEDDEVLLQRIAYGDNAGITDPEDENLRGRPIRTFDSAGVTRAIEFDFKGNLLESERQLVTVYDAIIDWMALDADTDVDDMETHASSALETEVFTETRQYDALNRPTSIVAPDESEILPVYNEAGLLDSVSVKVRGAETASNVVTAIEYDEKGRRKSIEYGNGTQTEYEYDELTFRLVSAVSTRTSPAATLQDLSYTYDPVGNIVQIHDAATPTLFWNNTVTDGTQQFVYDATYRLIQAKGREHGGSSVSDVQLDDTALPIRTLPHENDSAAMRPYIEDYSYDAVGNILEMAHTAVGYSSASWTRTYSYVTDTNRLDENSIPGGTASYTYDEHGSMISMPHLSSISYSPFDQMSEADLGGGGTVYFVYGADGQRVRKVHEHDSSTLVEERLYLGGFEIYRKHDSSDMLIERETLHIMDGTRRVTMIETKTIEDDEEIEEPESLWRFQMDNHLGSACLELDEEGAIISYEEYHPYGTSSYRAAASGTEVSERRYRYIGKEADSETGLYSLGVRYYVPWLARWTSGDPSGIQADGPGLYSYSASRPTVLSDPSGSQAVSTASTQEGLRTAAKVVAGIGAAGFDVAAMQFTIRMLLTPAAPVAGAGVGASVGVGAGGVAAADAAVPAAAAAVSEEAAVGGVAAAGGVSVGTIAGIGLLIALVVGGVAVALQDPSNYTPKSLAVPSTGPVTKQEAPPARRAEPAKAPGAQIQDALFPAVIRSGIPLWLPGILPAISGELPGAPGSEIPAEVAPRPYPQPGRQIEPGSTDLSRATQRARFEDEQARKADRKAKLPKGTEGNYAAARLSDGRIIVRRSGAVHSEPALIDAAQEMGVSIVEIYTERAPCQAGCEAVVQGIELTYSYPWNNEDKQERLAIREKTSLQIAKDIKDWLLKF